MPLKTKPEYVSIEDFKTYTGIDLHEELAEGTDPNLWLRDAEDQIIAYVNMQSWRPITRWIYEHRYTQDQMDAFRMAILLQAKYIFFNGNVNMNNGIDPEDGVKMKADDRSRASISPDAINMLINFGIITLTMRSSHIGHWVP